MTYSLHQDPSNTDDASSGNHYLTSDVSKVLGVTPAAVRAAVATGRIKAAHVTVGGVHVFHASEVQRVVEIRERLRSLRAQVKAAFL